MAESIFILISRQHLIRREKPMGARRSRTVIVSQVSLFRRTERRTKNKKIFKRTLHYHCSVNDEIREILLYLF